MEIRDWLTSRGNRRAGSCQLQPPLISEAECEPTRTASPLSGPRKRERKARTLPDLARGAVEPGSVPGALDRAVRKYVAERHLELLVGAVVGHGAEILPRLRMRQIRCPSDFTTPRTPSSGIWWIDARFSKPAPMGSS